MNILYILIPAFLMIPLIALIRKHTDKSQQAAEKEEKPVWHSKAEDDARKKWESGLIHKPWSPQDINK